MNHRRTLKNLYKISKSRKEYKSVYWNKVINRLFWYLTISDLENMYKLVDKFLNVVSWIPTCLTKWKCCYPYWITHRVSHTIKVQCALFDFKLCIVDQIQSKFNVRYLILNRLKENNWVIDFISEMHRHWFTFNFLFRRIRSHIIFIHFQGHAQWT